MALVAQCAKVLRIPLITTVNDFVNVIDLEVVYSFLSLSEDFFFILNKLVIRSAKLKKLP